MRPFVRRGASVAASARRSQLTSQASALRQRGDLGNSTSSSDLQVQERVRGSLGKDVTWSTVDHCTFQKGGRPSFRVSPALLVAGVDRSQPQSTLVAAWNKREQSNAKWYLDEPHLTRAFKPGDNFVDKDAESVDEIPFEDDIVSAVSLRSPRASKCRDISLPSSSDSMAQSVRLERPLSRASSESASTRPPSISGSVCSSSLSSMTSMCPSEVSSTHFRKRVTFKPVEPDASSWPLPRRKRAPRALEDLLTSRARRKHVRYIS